MAILGAVVTAIYAGWTAILRAAKVGRDAAEEVQRTRIAMWTVDKALACAVMFSTNAYFYSFDADNSGDFARLSFVSRLPSSFPGNGMFPGQPMRRVTFEVEPNAAGDNQFVMRQMPVFQVLEAGEEPYPIVLSRKITQFGVEFWDERAREWTYEWLQTNQLPRLVRVYCSFGERKGNLSVPANVEVREIALTSSAVAPEQQVGQFAGGGLNTNTPGLLPPGKLLKTPKK